jgi:hypothetical protein
MLHLSQTSYKLRGGLSYFTFPSSPNSPSRIFKLLNSLLVTFHITAKLPLPIIFIKSWRCRMLATNMPMPKTPVYKNNDSIFRKNDIRFSRQLRLVQAITESCLEKRLADIEFRRCIRCPDTSHNTASGGLVITIHVNSVPTKISDRLTRRHDAALALIYPDESSGMGQSRILQ